MGVKKTHGVLNLVPWESWHLWNQVRKAVFSSSQSRVSAALDKIAAWRARSSLPIAVEATGDLIRIHRADPRFSGISTPESTVTDEMLRLMYATAIMRLVNGVVDRSKRQNSMSVAARAEAARFPRLLVDIRHEVAHKELPSLSYLQLASKQALEWLKVQYWEAQKQVLDDAYGYLNGSLVGILQGSGPTLMPDEMGRTDLLLTNNSVADVELNKYECALLEAKKRLRLLHRTDLLPTNARSGKLEELVCGNSVDNTIDVEFKKIECALLEAKECLRSLHKSTHTMLYARRGPVCKVPIDTVDFSVANSSQKIDKGRAEEQSSLKEAWTITDNWKPCAIGMLPSASQSTGVLPFFGNMFSGLSGEAATFQGDSSSEAEVRISMEEDAIAAVCVEIKNPDGKSKFVGKKRDLVENETKKGMLKRFKPDTEAMQTPEKRDDSCRIDTRVHSDVSNEEPELVRSGLLLLENGRASLLSGGFLLLDGSYQRCGVDQLAAIRCAIQVLK